MVYVNGKRCIPCSHSDDVDDQGSLLRRCPRLQRTISTQTTTVSRWSQSKMPLWVERRDASHLCLPTEGQDETVGDRQGEEHRQRRTTPYHAYPETSTVPCSPFRRYSQNGFVQADIRSGPSTHDWKNWNTAYQGVVRAAELIKFRKLLLFNFGTNQRFVLLGSSRGKLLCFTSQIHSSSPPYVIRGLV